MAIAHPQFGMVRKTRGQLLIQRNSLCIAANPAKRCGFQVLLDGIVTPFRQNGVEIFQRLWKSVLFIQHSCQIGPRRAKIRRQFQCAAQQSLAIFQPANAGGQFGHHADRRDIGGRRTQMPAQNRFCILQPVFCQSYRRRHEVGVA